MGCSACSRTKKISYPKSKIRSGIFLSSNQAIKMNSFNLMNTRKTNKFNITENKPPIQKKFITKSTTRFNKLLF